MLDPVVRAKVQMTKSSNDLQVHIPPEHLVKELGGTNDWSWEFTPPESGENEKQQDTATKERLMKQREQLIEAYENVTRKWCKTDGSDETLNLIRELCCWRLRIQNFELDPYVRGRSVYHRHGNIVGNGLVSFEYPNKSRPDEWEVRGFDKSRESLQLRCQLLEAKIKAMGGKLPPGVDEADDEDQPKRKSRKSRD